MHSYLIKTMDGIFKKMDFLEFPVFFISFYREAE